MRRVLACVIVLAVASSAFCGDEARAALRRDFVELVERMESEERRSARSPSAAVRHLLSGDAEDVRAVVEEAWRTGGGAPARREAVERLVRFLYDLPQPALAEREEPYAIPVLESGVFRVRETWGDDAPLVLDPASPPPLETSRLVRLRRMPDASWDDVFRELDGDGPLARHSHVRDEGADVAEALGEACAIDAEVRARVVRLLRAAPERAELAMAAVRSRVPELVALVEATLADVAARFAREHDAESYDVLRAVLPAYAREFPERALAEVERADGPRRAALLRCLPPALKCRWFVPRLDKAGAADKLPLLRELRDAVYDRPPTSDAADAFASLVRALETCVREPALRDVCLEIVERAWYPRFRSRTGGSSSSSGRGVERHSGGNTGPYPDAAQQFDRLVEDLRAGRLRFLDRPPDVFHPTRGVLRSALPARTDVAPPRVGERRDVVRLGPPAWAAGEPPTAFAPFNLSAVPTDKGLRLTWTNGLTETVALDAASLRYGCAERTRHEPAEGEPFDVLILDVGRIGGLIGSTDLGIVEVAPGKSFSWDAALLPEDRDAEHVGVRLRSSFVPLGAGGSPVLTELGTTWVR